jgi:hypothetical protein
LGEEVGTQLPQQTEDVAGPRKNTDNKVKYKTKTRKTIRTQTTNTKSCRRKEKTNPNFGNETLPQGERVNSVQRRCKLAGNENITLGCVFISPQHTIFLPDESSTFQKESGFGCMPTFVYF